MKSGLRLTIASSEANPPKVKPRSPAALNSPVSASSEDDEVVAARHPAAPRQRQHAIMPVRHGLTRARHRRIEPRDFRRRAVGMPDEVAEVADLDPAPRPGFAAPRVRRDAARSLSATPASSACRTGWRRRCRASAAARPRRRQTRPDSGRCRIAGALPGVPRKPAEAEDLFGIGQRQQQLIGADVHRHDARQRCAANARSSPRDRERRDSRAAIRKRQRIRRPPRARSRPRADIPRDRR